MHKYASVHLVVHACVLCKERRRAPHLFEKDDEDQDLIATALREANEEISLPHENVEVVGTLSGHETVTGFLVTPVISVVSGKIDLQPERGEVEEIFEVPLEHVLNLNNYAVQSRRWQGQQRHYQTVPLVHH